MFNLFKKKKKNIDTNQVKDFNNILKIIEDFILFEEFNKAEKAIQEVLHKENESFKYYIDTVAEKDKKEELKNFKKKILKIEALKEKNDTKKRKHEINIKQRKKKEEIKFVKQKTTELMKTANFDESIALVNNLIERNLKDVDILNLGNELKKNISKEMEKYKQKKQKEIKRDAFKEAQELIWEIVTSKENENTKTQNTSFLQIIKNKFNFYGSFKKRLKEKRLIDEVNLLLQSQSEKDELTAKAKLAQVHSGISREIYREKISGYEIYGKIMWADKISGDSLGFHKWKNDTTFFIWDATWHGIRAWFIISQLNKKFHELAGTVWLADICLAINNSLKQELKSGNFITSIFFHLTKNKPNSLEFIWMGHEPIFVFRKATGTVEKIIPWWLAAWIRLIKDVFQIKTKEIIFHDGDILITYTDWIVEAKNEFWEMYSIDRVAKKLEEFGRNGKNTLEDIYKKFIDDLKKFTGGKANYSDDVTLLLLKRDKNKDILEGQDVENLIQKEWIEKKYRKKITGKSLEEVREEILRIQKENSLKNIIRSLDILYKTGELPKLKMDCIRYIKEWYIHKKINFYLKKALDNENAFKIGQKNKKMQDKYNVLKELLKKWDYETVISECSSIISKNGNI